MAEHRCLLLGQPRFERPEGPVRLASLKAQALLWYLAAQPDRLFSRPHLAALFWEEADEATGRNNLSTTLTRLRQALPVWPVRAEGDALGWAPAGAVTVDVIDFRHLAPAEAVALWRGPFLEGFALPDSEAFQSWLQVERQGWEQRMLDLLGQLAEAAEQAADWKGAIRHAAQAVRIDPLQERFYRTLMRAYCQTGDRASALASYAACEKVLGEELGLDPEPATAELRTAIVMGTVGAPPSGGGVGLGGRVVDSAGGTSSGGPVASPAGAGAAAPAIPLAGRTAELQRLEQALAEGARGAGRVILLHGEAGIGKTRLVEELLWRLRQPAPPLTCRTLSVGRCYEAAGSLPYAPFVEALTGALAHVRPADLPVAPLWLAEVHRLLPDLVRPDQPLPTPPPLEPGQERRRLFEGVARCLSALPQPCVLVLEDLHLADEASLQLLAYLVRQPLTQLLTIVATVRAGETPEPLEALLAELRRQDRLRTIELLPLPPASIGSLVQSLTRQADAALTDRIYTETQGNPLFAVELVRTLNERGAADGPLPRTVQAVIQGRLARLSRAARDLTTALAVFPRGTALPVLQAVAGLAEETALDAAEELLQAGICQEVTEARSVRLAFGHEMYRRVVGEAMSRTRVQYWHRRAYQALEGSQVAEELAYHAVAGGQWEDGLRWSEAAAGAAVRVFAYPAAVRFGEQALACVAQLPPAPALEARAIDIRLRLAQVSLFFQPGRLEEWLAPAEAASRALGDAVRLAQVRLARAGADYISGRLTPAFAVLDELLPTVRQTGVAPLLAACTTLLGEVLAARGDYERAVAVLREAIPLQQQAGNHLDEAVARNMLAGALAYLGRFPEAEDLLAEQQTRDQALGDAAAHASTLGMVAAVALMRGQWRRAADAGREAVRLAREAENLVHQYVPMVFAGLALARTGDVAVGLAAQQEAIALAGLLGTRIILGQAHGWLGEIYLAAGKPAQAEAAARQGLALALEDGARFDAALCTRVLGEALGRDGRLTEAIALLQDALRHFTEMGVRPEVARCHAALGALGAGHEHSRAAEALAAELEVALR